MQSRSNTELVIQLTSATVVEFYPNHSLKKHNCQPDDNNLVHNQFERP